MNEISSLQIERYDIREKIGTGGMARVYKAWDGVLERFVAIKVLHEHLADDATFKERFEREAKFVASFNHPNIVQVYDYHVSHSELSTLCYMVMSYVPGKTLREYLEAELDQRTRLSSERVLQLMLNLTDALGYAHARGMAHRDVKPGNVLLDEHGQAILTDFGIARLVENTRLTQDGFSSGTPAYMSPEQAKGEAGDMRSDLYSLAIILYEMLAGQTPFNDTSSMSIMLKHLNDTPPPLSTFNEDIPAAVNLFLERALAKRPQDRYQTATAFAQALHNAFRGEVAPDVDEIESTLVLPSATSNGIANAPSIAAQSPTTRLHPKNDTILETLTQKVSSNRTASVSILISGLLAMILLFFIVRGTPVSDVERSGSAGETNGDELQNAQMVVLGNFPYFRTRFNDDEATNAGWEQGDFGSLSRVIADGIFTITNNRLQNAEATIFNSDAQYDDLSVVIEATLSPESHPASGYGVIFHYQNEDNYHVFAVDGLGRFSLWHRTNGEWQDLRGEADHWTQNDRINTIGEENLVSVNVTGDVITGYVNQVVMVSLTDESLTTGQTGIYTATNDDIATVMIDSFQVRSSVPAMTGE